MNNHDSWNDRKQICMTLSGYGMCWHLVENNAISLPNDYKKLSDFMSHIAYCIKVVLLVCCTSPALNFSIENALRNLDQGKSITRLIE